MKERLNRIVTRSGDDGTTGLADGQRLPKHHARIVALGDVDELNSSLGVLLSENIPEAVATVLQRIQHELFDLGGELAMPGQSLLTQDAVLALEQDLQRWNGELPALEEFILPGGTRSAAWAHVCRCQARRAERSVVRLRQDDEPGTSLCAQHYLNRLSDLLFVVARVLNRMDSQHPSQEIYWRSQRLRS